LYKDALAKQQEGLAYESFYNNQGYKQGPMPWLFYLGENAKSILEKPEKVQFRASFDYQNLSIGIVSRLRFVIAIYDLEGNFHGFEDLYD